MKITTDAAPATPISQLPWSLGAGWQQRARVLVSDVSPEIVFVGLVLLTALTASVLWALILPYNAAPDEVHHFNMDWFIASHNQLPIFDVSREINHTVCQGNKGPCYASYASVPVGGPLLGAAFMTIAHLVTGQSFERYPSFFANGIPLDALMTAARLASALCIGAYVLFLYLICRILLDDRFVRLSALMIGAFIPQVTFVGGYVNDDSLVVAAAAAMLYLSIRMLRNGLSRGAAAATGAGLGVLALSRVNGYPVFLIFAVCAVLRLRHESRSGRAKPFVGTLALTCVVAALISGWWFVRGALLYGDPIGLFVLRRHIDAVAPGYGASTPAGHGMTLLSMFQDPIWRSWSFNSFWGEFDYMALPLSPRAYGWIHWCVLVGVLGVLAAVIKYFLANRPFPSEDRWRAEVWLMFGALVLIVVLESLWNSLTLWFEPQGRYLFPALVPIALILAAGVHGWSGWRPYRALAFGLVTLGMVALNVYALVFVVVPAYNSW